MRRGPTIFMGAIFALLAGGLWYFDLSRTPEESGLENEAEIELLGDVDWSALERIEISLGEVPVVLSRADADTAGGARWRLVEPVDAPADEGAVESVLRELEGLAGEPVATVQAQGLEAYGLEGALGEVRLVFGAGASGESIERVLRIGADAPFGHQVYLWLEGDPEIHVTPAYLRTVMGRSPFELRRKKLATFSAFDVRSLRIERAGALLALEREGDRWWMVQPLRAPARTEGVEALVDGLTGLRASAFIEPFDAETAAGFDPPELRVEVGLAERDEAEIIEVGRHAPVDGERILRISGASRGAIVPATALDALVVEPDDLRDRRLLFFDRDAVAGVEVIGADFELRIDRLGSDAEVREPDAGRWKIDGEQGEPLVDAANVNQMLITLASLEVKRWLDAQEEPSPSEAGLEKAYRELRLLSADGAELARFKVGRAVAAPDRESGERYVRVSGGTGVVVVSDAFLEDLPESAEAWITTDADGHPAD